MPNNPPKVAWVSPFPPQRSGIANYSYWLVKALGPRLDIDLYYENRPPSPELQDEFDSYPLSDFAKRFAISCKTSCEATALAMPARQLTTDN